MNIRLLLSLCSLLVCSMAFANWGVIKTSDNDTFGTYLITPQGMAMYIFANDEINQSNCTGACAANWPAVTISSEAELAEGFEAFEREGGVLQLSYLGLPLYTFIGDQEPGDTNGQDVGGVWFLSNLLPLVQASEHPDHGTILTDANGMTLYTFANDSANQSNCSGGCLASWPALAAATVPAMDVEMYGQLELVAHAEGPKQLSYNGQPLYYWIGDQAPGDTSGHGMGGVWHVATKS